MGLVQLGPGVSSHDTGQECIRTAAWVRACNSVTPSGHNGQVLLYHCYTFCLILGPPFFCVFWLHFTFIINTNKNKNKQIKRVSIVCPYCKQSKTKMWSKCTGTINTCVPTTVQTKVIQTHYTNSKKNWTLYYACVRYCSPNRCSSNVQASNLTKFSSTTWNWQKYDWPRRSQG